MAEKKAQAAVLAAYTPPDGAVVHNVDLSLDERGVPGIVHLVQYDQGLQVIAAGLWADSQPWAVPEDVTARVRLSKPDGNKVYNDVAGFSADRRTVYVVIDQQMTAAAGSADAIIELTRANQVAGTARMVLVIDKNPVTQEDIQSSSEYKSLEQAVSDAKGYAEDAARSAASAEGSANTADTKLQQTTQQAEAAEASAQAAKGSEDAAAAAAAAAADSQTAAAESARQAADSAAQAAKSAGSAAKSEENAGNSETAAAASAAAAGKSEMAAAGSAEAAKASENATAACQTAAAQNAEDAAASEIAALASQQAAAESETAAAASAEAAARSEMDAKASAADNLKWANTSKSYAVGEGLGDERPNEATENAAYYYDQVRRIAEGLASGLIPMGTITFDQLAGATRTPGYMYNISDAFMTTEDFEEGAGHSYPAGTNVYWTGGEKWDAIAGAAVTGVKGSAESVYRSGEVNLTSENIGAMSAEDTRAALTETEQKVTQALQAQQQTVNEALEETTQTLTQSLEETEQRLNEAVEAAKKETAAAAEKATTAAAKATSRSWPVTLLLDGWDGGDEDGYSQTVDAEGMTADVRLAETVAPVMSGRETPEEKEELRAALACLDEVESGAGTVTVYCYGEKPERELQIYLQEVR